MSFFNNQANISAILCSLHSIAEILVWLLKFSKGKTLLMNFNRRAWFIWSILWYQNVPCMKYTSEYPALRSEEVIETFSTIILLIKKKNTCCKRLWCFWFLSYILWWLQCLILQHVIIDVRKQLIQEFRSQSKMTMLKSRISYAMQNSACQIVGWKPKAADSTFQCCSLQYQAIIY